MSVAPNIQLYLTPEHPCPYLQRRVARNLVADPEKVNGALYAKLVTHGFRRSGDYLYRPHCEHCHECQSLRVSVPDFRTTGSLRRVLRKNQDLEFVERRPNTGAGVVELYRRYLLARHRGGGMDEADPDTFAAFLIAEWCDTRFYEIRLRGELLGVAVTDDLGNALSAVYTFFEPGSSTRGLGNWAILQQIQAAAREAKPWLYLGYWIRDSRKMAYKNRFRPHERYQSGHWLRV